MLPPRLVLGMSRFFDQHHLRLTSDHSFTLREGGKTSESPFDTSRKHLMVVLRSRDWHRH